MSARRRSYDAASTICPIASSPNPQLPQQQDLAQPLQVRIVVQPVAVLRSLGRDQEPDPIVVVECADRDLGEGRDLADGVEFFGVHEGKLNPDVTAEVVRILSYALT